ncbi:insulinase family protein [Kitasatospora paranensis]|uniref:M16 family metallopeptidase n=1 Tax=Kitasatospora paranensis TaxID=258053 RepID=A0ABW2FUS7_9ACTN
MIHHFEVDGVPALYAPRAGRLSAGLVFRVGRADETLPGAGITHLVEHLALHRSGVQVHRFNGATGLLHTHFHLEGGEQDVRSFLLSVCQSLTALPMDRLETEKAILRTEESGRGAGAGEAMGLWRYGAQGHGLVSYPEWGVPGLHPQTVQQWADTWFTRENAALWIAGEQVPADLRLPLRPGRRMPLPAPTSALPQTPAYFDAGQGQVLFDTVLPRTAAAELYTACLDRELFQDLRQEGGYSYTVGADHTHRGDGMLTVTALADALPEQQAAALGGFVDVLARLAETGVAPEGFEALRRRADEAYAAPAIDAERLPGCAADLLSGLPVRTGDELRAELRSVAPADVHAVAQQALGGGLLRVPAGRRADWAGYRAAPTTSAAAVYGTSHRSVQAGGPELVIARDGVSLVDGTEAATVRYDACAAVLAWPDGGRRLIGTDGITVQIEPACHLLDTYSLAVVDGAVPPHLFVAMPPRQPPAPYASGAPSAAGPRAAARAADEEAKPGIGRRILGVLQTTVAVVWGLLVLMAGLGAIGDDSYGADYWIFIGFLAACEAALVYAIVRRRKRWRAARGN